MTVKLLLITFAVIGMHLPCQSQDSPTTFDKIAGFPDKFFNKVSGKAVALESSLDRQTEKYLQRLVKREAKLKRKLSRIDSTAAQKLFANSSGKYSELIEKMKRAEPGTKALGGEYLKNLDSLQGCLSFLQQNGELFAGAKNISGKAQQSLSGVQQLQSKLRQAEEIKQFIRRRNQQLKESLSRYTKLPKNLTKDLQNFNKDIEYYSQTVRLFRESLNDPGKLEQQALSVLSKLPAFQQFMRENSQLAGLFRLPANYGSAQSLAGLQTRDQVQGLILNQLASAGPNAQQILRQNLQTAQAQLNQLKDKLNKPGGGSSDTEMPEGKLNNEKALPFKKRLEVSTNLQTQRSNLAYPTTSDVGLSIGYRLSDKAIIGLGGSAKIGFGRDIRHIVITGEGASIRSFFDFRIKRSSFYASAAFEYNYQRPFGSIQQVNDLDSWRKSGLLGLSKVVSLRSKLFKKTKLSLFWDWLSYRQGLGQPVKFRIAYSF